MRGLSSSDRSIRDRCLIRIHSPNTKTPFQHYYSDDVGDDGDVDACIHFAILPSLPHTHDIRTTNHTQIFETDIFLENLPLVNHPPSHSPILDDRNHSVVYGHGQKIKSDASEKGSLQPERVSMVLNMDFLVQQNAIKTLPEQWWVGGSSSDHSCSFHRVRVCKLRSRRFDARPKGSSVHARIHLLRSDVIRVSE